MGKNSLLIIYFKLLFRKFEKSITIYQNELRQNIYKEQLGIYHEIGQEKLDRFYYKYDEIFKEVN